VGKSVGEAVGAMVTADTSETATALLIKAYSVSSNTGFGGFMAAPVSVGASVGASVGTSVGTELGIAVGEIVGDPVGMEVGTGVAHRLSDTCEAATLSYAFSSQTVKIWQTLFDVRDGDKDWYSVLKLHSVRIEQIRSEMVVASIASYSELVHAVSGWQIESTVVADGFVT
jgi:hypothetical protein